MWDEDMKQLLRILNLVPCIFVLSIGSACYAQATVQNVFTHSMSNAGTSIREISVNEREEQKSFNFSLATDSKNTTSTNTQTVDGVKTTTQESFNIYAGSSVMERGHRVTVTNVQVRDTYDYVEFTFNNSLSIDY